ncbi:MAG: hypothetical protein D6824_04425 [Planctomycetota bacterium]|nr:MAG: hypothetical protein D6824_04425 [Planctomycetota bacterium]
MTPAPQPRRAYRQGRRCAALLAAGLAVALLEACAAAPSPATDRADRSLVAPPGRYAQTFDAVRDVLRDLGLALDRVDARSGVITTVPASSGGLFTPWSRLDPSLADAFRRTLRYERVRVRVRFAPVDAEGASEFDIRRFDKGARVVVEALVEPVDRPGLRVSPISPRLASVTRSSDAAPPAAPRAPFPASLPERDEHLERAISRAVRKRLGS